MNNTKKMRDFISRDIAHRGIFDNDGENPENSMKAFEKAINLGFAIELDIQITKDDKLAVFHDEKLDRMCGESKYIVDCTYIELKNYKLLKSNEGIHLLEDVLKKIDRKVPLIIEVKSQGKAQKKCPIICKKLGEALDKYDGPVCIKSFNPFVVLWFKKNRPDTPRGQLSTNFMKEDSNLGLLKNFVLNSMVLNIFTKPDFISFDHRYTNMIGFRLYKKLFKPVTAVWTIKNAKDYKQCKQKYDMIIFDSFIPERN